MMCYRTNFNRLVEHIISQEFQFNFSIEKTKKEFYFVHREDFKQMLKDYCGKFGNGKEIK